MAWAIVAAMDDAVRQSRGFASIDVILAETASEREAQLQHFDALDSKAGIALGFAGAIVALTRSGQLLVDLGRLVAVLSGLVSLWAFWPRKYDVIDLYKLRQKYLGARPQFAKLLLLDTKIRVIEQTAAVLHTKARRLKIAMTALALAGVLVAVGIALD